MADSAINSITSASSSYTAQAKTDKKSGELDKDAFLQLLVTQMQYQDPLNPGDSTEYMSQLAQYSSLEATMNINETLDKNTTDAAGNASMVSGLVEYATVKNGEVLLSIEDKYYPAADLDSVVDYDYYLYLKDVASKENSADGSSETDNSGNDTEQV